MRLSKRLLATCLSALPLTWPGCAAQQRATTEPAKPAKPAGAAGAPDSADGEMEGEAAALVRSFVDAYDALGSGDIDGAVAHFPTSIVWDVVGAGSHTLSGRDELRDDWKSGGSSVGIGLARVFLTDSNVLIAQGVRVEGERGTGFVTISTAEGSRITGVKEFRTSSRGESAGPPLPAAVELVFGGGDVVNRITAEGIRSDLSQRGWIKRQDTVGAEILHHNMSSGETTRGIDAYRERLAAWTDGFPDLNIEILRSWAVGDFVVIERRTRGTNTAKLSSQDAATLNDIDFQGLDIYRFDDGTIVEVWSYDDGAMYSAQLQ